MSALAVSMLSSIERAAVLLDPLRLRIVQELGTGDTSTGIAKKLSLPRQKVNYHLRELERVGVVELVEERRKGNCLERVVRAVATSYLINPEVLGPLATDPSLVEDKLSSAYLVAVAAKAIRDLATLRERATAAGKKLPTLTLQSQVRFATAADRNAFAEELANFLATLAAKYHDDKTPDGRKFEFFVGAYPTITKKSDAAT
ncbi:MAG: winged helix-turn-helix domain-containing protein [Phycisphaerae bacterium]